VVKMTFSGMIKFLQEANPGRLVLIKMGTFYIARGKDAVFLNRELNLKVICLEKEICKVGFPIHVLEKYIEKINKLKVSYVIYDYDKEENKLKEIAKKDGKKVEEKEERVNCLLCGKAPNYYKNIDKYEEALRDLYGR